MSWSATVPWYCLELRPVVTQASSHDSAVSIFEVMNPQLWIHRYSFPWMPDLKNYYIYFVTVVMARASLFERPKINLEHPCITAPICDSTWDTYP